MTLLKKNDPLPDGDHVMRRVSYQLQERDTNDDSIVLGLLPGAFELRELDNGGLSVTWLEYFRGTHAANISDSIAAISNCMRGSQKRAVFATASVGELKAASKKKLTGVRVIYDPTSCNKGHAAVRRLPPEDIEMLDTLAVDTFSDVRDFNGKPVLSSR